MLFIHYKQNYIQQVSHKSVHLLVHYMSITLARKNYETLYEYNLNIYFIIYKEK